MNKPRRALEAESDLENPPAKKKKAVAKKSAMEAELDQENPPAKKKNGTTKKPAPTTQKKPMKKKPIKKAANTAPLSDKTENTNPQANTITTDLAKTRYQEHEDIQICKSWLEVSQDPLNSTNQTADTFWNCVAENFAKFLPDESRSGVSIKSRWQVLQRRINKFSGCVKQVELSNQSGTTVEDRLSSALKLYKALSEETFSHLRCYNLLNLAPKWRDHCAEVNKKQNPAHLSSSVTPSQSLGIEVISVDSIPAPSLSFESNNNDNGNNSEASTIRSHSTSRPIGNRKAKELAAKAREDKYFKDNILTVHKELAENSRLQVKILSEQKEAITTIADDSIMKVELSTVSNHSRSYYEWQQKKVLDRMQKEKEEYEKKQKEEEEKKRKEEEKKKEEEARKEAERKKGAKRNKSTADDYDESKEDEGSNDEDDVVDEEEEDSSDEEEGSEGEM